MTEEHPEHYRTRKDVMQEAYIQGYLEGYGVESPSRINKQTAREKFYTWFEVNYE